MFYLTMHSTHFIYFYMASDIWLRTILIVRKETRCHHIGYSYRLAARVLLYAPSHRQDNTYHGLCYTSRGALTKMLTLTLGSLGRARPGKRVLLMSTALFFTSFSLVSGMMLLVAIGFGFIFFISHSRLATRESWNHKRRKEIFNNALNTFYLQLYGVRHMAKDHSESERGRKEIFYLRLYGVGHMVKHHSESERGRKEGIILFMVIWCWTYGTRPLREWERKEWNALFNDTLNTFYLQLYGVGYMVNVHSESERGRKEMFYLTTLSIHFIYGYMVSDIW